MISKTLDEFLNNHPEMKDSDFLNTPEFLENFDLAFFVINREGELLFANQKTSNFFPYTTDEFNIFEKIISPTRSDIFESLDYDVHFFEVAWKKQDVRRYGELNIKKLSGTDKSLYACSLRDITHRKNNEAQRSLLHKEVIEELSQLNKQIYQTSETITIGKVNYALNHLIVNNLKDVNISYNNIMNKIIELSIDNDEIMHELMNIKTNCNEMQLGIQKFQDSAKRDNQLQLVDVKSTIKSVYGYFESYLADKRINFILESDLRFKIKTQPIALENIFVHLFDNAIDALEKCPSGEIKNFKIKMFEDSNHYQVIIQDNGESISEKESYGIFEAYYSTKGKDTHLGLGLTLIRNFMHDLGGEIYLHLENGSKYFQLSFPKDEVSSN
ncbi:MAG: HAMP domain-containing sensor histidine kinase [Bdellovibrionota bacterium]|nr:HAMP domain-containing sensor histidine kinase [Bdellovibrionota bacterium]